MHEDRCIDSPQQGIYSFSLHGQVIVIVILPRQETCLKISVDSPQGVPVKKPYHTVRVSCHILPPASFRVLCNSPLDPGSGLQLGQAGRSRALDHLQDSRAVPRELQEQYKEQQKAAESCHTRKLSAVHTHTHTHTHTHACTYGSPPFVGPPRFLHPQEPDTLLSLGLRVLEFRVQG